VQWNEIQQKYHQASKQQQKLVLNYDQPDRKEINETWLQLVGIVKYLVRTQKQVSKQQLTDKLAISDRALELGLIALEKLGFGYNRDQNSYQFVQHQDQVEDQAIAAINLFVEVVTEENFQQSYFAQVPLPIITKHLTS